ncbi:MAG: hypothetical protein ACRDTF_04590 [Pseudonocardiaceae bacterium]
MERWRAPATVELLWELTEQLIRHVRLPPLDLPDLQLPTTTVRLLLGVTGNRPALQLVHSS